MKKLKLLFMLCLSMFFAIGKKPFPLPCGNIFNALIGNLQSNNQGIPPFFGNSLNFGSNTAQTLFNGRMGIYNLLKTQAVNSASLQGAAAFMAAQGTTDIGKFYTIDDLTKEYTETGNTSKLAQATIDNSGVNASANVEQLQKTYNSIYHTYLVADTLVTLNDLNTLIGIAQLCPFTDGTSVYQARALLSHYDTTTYVNPCEFVTQIQGVSQRIMNNIFSEQTDNTNLSEFTQVYPNPASGELTIATNITGARIVVYNLLGQILIDETLNNATSKINLNELKSGTYLYKIMQDKKIIKTDKLIISK